MTESEGSLFKIPVTTIRRLRDHNNSDSLAFATIYGFDVIVKRGQYHEGQIVIYTPVDSVLPMDLESELFGEGSKIKLHNGRVRQIKIRGAYSQGMLIPLEVAGKYGITKSNLVPEMDLAAILGITKYVPPNAQKENTGPKKRDKPKENIHLHKYNGISALKWDPDRFVGEEVVVQEKLHGSNCRAGYLPTSANTLWKKIKKLFGLLPKYEYVWGSNNVQLQARPKYEGYYGSDVYKDALEKADAFSKIKPNETCFLELIGEGVQKNYHYGHREKHVVLFDVKILQPDGSQVWLSPEEVEAYAKERGFDFVPVLYTGPWDKDIIDKLTTGPSVYYPEHKVREGIVVKSRTNYSIEGNKQVFKIISPVYLDDKSNTDNQ